MSEPEGIDNIPNILGISNILGAVLRPRAIWNNFSHHGILNNNSHLEHLPGGFFISGTQVDIYMGRTNELTNHETLNQEAAMKASERMQIIFKSLIPVVVYFGFIAIPLILYSVPNSVPMA